MDAEAYIAERTPLVDAWLEDFVPPADAPPAELHAAMRHLLFPGGKRLRPALAMAAAEAVGERPERALPVAGAVELLHTYSLIHDDLPCMDDDALRRGIPTVHVAFTESTAVLAGDALQALAFEAVARAEPTAGAARAAGALRDLARAAGSSGLVGGQLDDLAAETSRAAIDAAAIESIHARKSAALITAAVVMGARVAGADDEMLARLRAFGLDVGVGFQIADDLLDADEDDASSLVRAIGPDAARARAEELLGRGLAHLDGFGERAEPLRELARLAVRRTR